MPAPTRTTVVANAGGTNSSEIQTLLDASTPTICLSGSFNVTADLTFVYDTTLVGVDAAVLDGGGAHHILWNPSGLSAVTVEHLTFAHSRADGFTFFDAIGGAIFADRVTAIDSVFTDKLRVHRRSDLRRHRRRDRLDLLGQ